MDHLFSLSAAMCCSALVLAAAAAFLWVLAAFLWVLGGMSTGQRGRLPPGPRGLPIIGHLQALGSLPHHTLAHLSKTYGPLMSLRLGSVPLLIASSPDMAKLFLHTHDKLFAGRPQNRIVVRNGFNFLEMGFSQPGPYWKRMRQLCFTEFFSAARLDYFRHMREEEVQSLILSIFAAEGRPICIREKLHTTMNSLIARMTMGMGLQELGWSVKKGGGLPSLYELFRMTGLINVSDYIPWLAWMDVQGLGERSRKAALISHSMFQEVIDTRRRGRGGGRSPSSDIDPPRDFLDILLKESFNSNHDFGDKHIRAIMMVTKS